MRFEPNHDVRDRIVPWSWACRRPAPNLGCAHRATRASVIRRHQQGKQQKHRSGDQCREVPLMPGLCWGRLALWSILRHMAASIACGNRAQFTSGLIGELNLERGEDRVP